MSQPIAYFSLDLKLLQIMNIVANQNHTMKHATGPFHNGNNITNNGIVGNNVNLRTMNKTSPSNDVPMLGPTKIIFSLFLELINDKLLA